MSTKSEVAAELFDSGFNCSQSVLAVFCEQYGLDKETAMKMSCGFGGGMRSGEVCGAVSGAVMVIGLKYGQFEADDKDSKKLCYSKTTEFLKAFKEKNEFIVCRQLLGRDISTKEGYEQAQNGNMFKTRCVDLIKSSVEILEELGY